MPRINLKRLLKNGGGSVLQAMYPEAEQTLTIFDVDHRILFGQATEANAPRESVWVEGTLLGWACGPQAAGAAALLSHLAGKEVELKSLGAEVLDRYREINLFYNLSEKLSGLLEPADLAEVILKEAARLIQSEAGFVVAVDAEGNMEVLANVAEALNPNVSLQFGKGLIGSLAQVGKAEIVGDLPLDERLFEGESDWRGLVSCPLKSSQRVVGVMGLLSHSPNVYTAGDLKLLTTLASQAAFQIDTTIIYRQTIREAADRAAQLQRQLESLLSFDIDHTQAEQDVAEIAKSDFFQELIARRSQRASGA